ncbi:MAG: hypothetical protein WD992_00230 [Candidatus Levyibacteriota bacterium]
MTKKQIDKLTLASYKGNKLNIKKIYKITSGISRRDLKMYIYALKNWERKHNVEIIIPDEKYKRNLNLAMIKRIFPEKEIKYSIDSTLTTGVKIINQDMVYDFNLKDTLEDIVEHIRAQYD